VLLSGTDPTRVFRHMADESLKLSGAEATLVAVPMDSEVPATEVSELVVVASAGDDASTKALQTIQVDGTAIGEAFLHRNPARFDTIGIEGSGPALLLPLRVTDAVAGVLVVLRNAGAPPFREEQLDMMAAFADQAALAWQLASTQRRVRELDVLTDRDRIARDLHDHVIQRLFAVGLALQGTIPRARSTEVQQRLSGCVDDLQQVIQEIRTAIFDLHGAGSGTSRLRQRLDEAVAQFSSPALRTTVQFVGPLSVIDAGLADHAEAVVREAVSNAVRHADASTLTVSVTVKDELSIEVVDNGKGLSSSITESGLSNLRERAGEVGGAFSIENVNGGGTALRWSAPLP
jgi:signal transduction histidine kinase